MHVNKFTLNLGLFQVNWQLVEMVVNYLLLLPSFRRTILSLSSTSLAFLLFISLVKHLVDMLYDPGHAGQPLFTPCVRSHCTPLNVTGAGTDAPCFLSVPAHSTACSQINDLDLFG